MKKNLKEKLEKIFVELPNLKNREGGNMPLFNGQKLSFTGETDIKSIDGNRYAVFKTVEGHDISFSQIARNGNGLELTNGKFPAMIDEFANRIPDDGVYVVILEKVKKQISTFGDGDNKQSYYHFKIVGVEGAEENQEEA